MAITKKEKNDFIKGTLLAIGAFMVYFPARDWIMKNLPVWLQLIVGAGTVYVALKVY